jgi:hypothetical protein
MDALRLLISSFKRLRHDNENKWTEFYGLIEQRNFTEALIVADQLIMMERGWVGSLCSSDKIYTGADLCNLVEIRMTSIGLSSARMRFALERIYGQRGMRRVEAGMVYLAEVTLELRREISRGGTSEAAREMRWESTKTLAENLIEDLSHISRKFLKLSVEVRRTWMENLLVHASECRKRGCRHELLGM